MKGSSNEPFDSVKYRNQFIRDNYDRLFITLPKGTKAIVKEHCNEKGCSVNSFVSEMILEALYKAGRLSD